MKAERVAPAFIPVTVTLESQAEVDALYALLNHAHVSAAVGLHHSGQQWEAVQPFCNKTNCVVLHAELNKILKR